MKLSVSKSDDISGFSHTHMLPIDVVTSYDLRRLITTKVYSPIVFSRDHYRSESGFLESSLCILDFDKNVTLKEIASRCHALGLFFVTAPTRNHRAQKEGKPCEDRFRLWLKFEHTITDLEQYRANMRHYAHAFNSDRACTGGAQFFYPSKEVVEISKGYPLQVLPRPSEAALGFKRFLIDEKLKSQRMRYRRDGSLPDFIEAFFYDGVLCSKDGRNTTIYSVAAKCFEIMLDEDFKNKASVLEDVTNLIAKAPFSRVGFSQAEIDAAVRSALKRIAAST